MQSLSTVLFAFLIASAACSQKKAAAPATPPEFAGYSHATFASGCFWCVEGIFESVIGVREAISGYSGGTTRNPTYKQVSTGSTGHAEVVRVYYDPEKISFETLVKVYFASQDPTQINGQGPDHGSQYRSIIFYENEQEKEQARKAIDEMNRTLTINRTVAASVLPAAPFYPAEDYHQNYVQKNPTASYVLFESIPRIKSFQQKNPQLIKPERCFIPDLKKVLPEQKE